MAKKINIPVAFIPEAKKQAKQWKSYRANSCSEAANWLNEMGIDPEFIFAGSNGQIIIFYTY